MSDIRKIQTGNNQYTLHARVSDKLAVNAQVGSPTKPVYVDSSGDVQACSREIPNIPYSVTTISSYLIGDFYYNAVYSYDGPGDNYMLRFFYLEPGDKIIVHTTDSYNLPLYFVNDDESFKLEVRVNTSVTVDDYVECVLRGLLHQDLPEGYVEIYRNNSTATDTFRLISDELNHLLSKQQANSLYVEKTNGPFCRYKGSVDSLSNLPSPYYLTREHVGDVYKIRTASTNNSITTNPGDYVVFVWDETKNAGHWDNLSGTVANVGYAEKIGTDKSHPQIGSPTKPVYVDSSGLVKACSRDIPTSMTIDSVLNDTSANAVLNKVINAALKGKNPKAKADFIASSDLLGLPITTGVLDLNGYTLTLSGTTLLTGTLTIKNGTIGGEGIISSEDAVLYIYDCLLSDSAKISISCIMFVADNLYYSHTLNESVFITIPTLSFNNKTIAWISNSSCIRIKGLLTSAGVNDFGTSSIINSTYIIILNIAINVKTSNTVFLSGVICAHIDSCSNVNVTADVPEFGIDEIDQNSIIQISNCIFDNGTNTSLMIEGSYDVQNHRYVQLGYVSSIEGYDTNNFYGLPTTNAILDYLKNYAKKSDISTVYKYKGTKTKFSELTTSGNTIGDVWNITNADAEHGIKAGDNVAWNGTAWDNLSGTVDLSAYATTTTTNAISADVKKLMDKAFPFTVKVSLDNILAKKGTSLPVKVTITPKIGDDNTDVDEIMINGAEHHGATPYVYSDTATTTTTYNVRVSKEGRTAQGSATITFVNPSYDGAVAANFTATEANIKALTETLRSGKGGTRIFNLTNQKACIAYPQSFGAAASIKDANGFDYLASYTRSEVTIDSVVYYVYLLSSPTTITDFKQIIN